MSSGWIPVGDDSLTDSAEKTDETQGMDESSTPRRKRVAEDEPEEEGRSSRPGSITPTRTEGEAEVREGSEPNGKVLGEDVEGHDASSNLNKAPTREHRTTAPEDWSKGESRWGTIFVPPRPEVSGVVSQGRGPCRCSHGILWRTCPNAACWDVSVLCTSYVSPTGGSALFSRMGL